MCFPAALVCETDTCNIHEVCVDTDEGFLCLCENGYNINSQGLCSKSPLVHFVSF